MVECIALCSWPSQDHPGTAAFSTLTVCGVHPRVYALATKTRPKRVALLGSDGRQHTYLLKGREDLRLDERLMQVMRQSCQC